ncbi:putative methylcrotonoyl-CoA carboxylase beta chain, mitochondrial [Lonchura striata]|uniref:methylcrotonoyl-CoA carboxylase n=1 Tax=Lonchura striata TaxID=40157 RepID=A0A218UJD7_9PASE|nr:putative methylcrotonoyl-CoA carboxylase beta chain, mitochondrial [Lonchura striata domestica]
MQKISIKLHSDSVSSSALHKFLKVLGEKSSGYTREGGKNQSEHQPSPKTPQISLNGAAAAEFVHGLHQEPLVAVSVPITSLDQYSELLERVKKGGGENAVLRHTQRNKKVLVRERLRLLLDHADFLELSPLAGLDLPYGDVPAAGCLTGSGMLGALGKENRIGRICGVWCVFIASDATVKGGTIYPIGVKKQLRAQEIAMENRLLSVHLVDSGGAFLPLQSELFPDKLHGGRIFYNEAIMSAMGIPQVAVVCGSCVAGGAYVPTMAEESVIIDKIGTLFLAGPPLVKAATGEDVSPEDLGGARLHSQCVEYSQNQGIQHAQPERNVALAFQSRAWSGTCGYTGLTSQVQGFGLNQPKGSKMKLLMGVSGCSDHFALSEEEAYECIRNVVSTLNCEPVPQQDREPDSPLYSPEELLGLAPLGYSCTLPVKLVLSRLVDGSRFQEFKATYGTTLVTGFGHVEGLEEESSAFYSSARLWDDGIILPQDTRKVIAQCLEIMEQKKYHAVSPCPHPIIRM